MLRAVFEEVSSFQSLAQLFWKEFHSEGHSEPFQFEAHNEEFHFEAHEEQIQIHIVKKLRLWYTMSRFRVRH